MSLATLSPADLDLPAKFTHWREGQFEAIDRLLTMEERVGALCLATGSGKSLAYMALAKLFGGRTCILVSTRGLQQQLTDDFSTLQLHDFRGQQNYECLATRTAGELNAYAWASGKTMCDFAPCHAGVGCSLKDKGCTYFDARRIAADPKTSLLLTNYSCYLAQYLHGQGLGDWDTLILDEAHEAMDELTSACAIEIKFDLIESVLHCAHPTTDDIKAWWGWARAQAPKLKSKLESKGFESVPATIKAKRVLQTLESLVDRVTEEDWIAQSNNGGIQFEPIYVEKLVELYLARGAKRVILVSATIRPKTLSMLGYNPADCVFHEAKSPFPLEHRRVVHVPTVQMNHRTSYEDLVYLVKRVDTILRARGDRKGIIHCTSYERARFVLKHSEFASRMITHTSETSRGVIQKFKASTEPLVLVSPSVTTGFDFPGRECEFQILLKVPFPDTRPPIMQVRTMLDPEYPNYLAMQTIVQTVGRGVRTPTDRCDTFTLDNNFSWFLRRNRHLAPAWFLEACSTSDTVPQPGPRVAL